MQTRLEEEGERLHTAFEIALKMTYSNMSQLATSVAEDPKVRQIFSQAGDALRREGGGPGGAEADALRKQLAEIRQLNRMLHDQAATDDLAGLKNRRYLMTRLGEEYARAAAEGAPLSVLVMDIDYFKKINDNHGHAVGDQVLEAVGRYLSGSCRSNDIVARYGGEEFCIVLLNTPNDKALLFTDRLRSEVEQQIGFTTQVGEVRAVTCSVGVCDNRHSRSTDNLINLADSALYAAKQ